MLKRWPGEDGYPKYRRRSPDDGGFTATIRQGNQREITVDNKWVVSYSPLLCKAFNAHINVEYCNSIKSIKYVCKYINKGTDQAVFTLLSSDRDEIADYQHGRYICSSEALWRIFSFPIHERYPTVVHLVYISRMDNVSISLKRISTTRLNHTPIPPLP